ncbi:DUF2851 family protein [Sphingobacterium sp. lm-10]|nr:DUF2851 family protein [Sphingobacterium sp. lm-10]
MIWKCRVYAKLDLRCLHGEPVRVLDPGIHNHNAGPDFVQAKLIIAEITWVGHVEMHWHAKSWYTHQHQKNDQYDNVILHVVWEGECDIKRKDGSVIPTLQLKNYLASTVLPLYYNIIQAKTWVPCANQLENVPAHIKIQVLDRLIKNRMEVRAKEISNVLGRYANDWERVARYLFVTSFGTKVNKQAFSRLMDSLPSNILDRYLHKEVEMESLLFGQAGLLKQDLADSYYTMLKHTYSYLQQLHQLTPMESREWLFSRMRPANFPTLRIAQLAAVFTQFSRLCHLIISARDFRELQQYLATLSTSAYWSTHYRFGTITKVRETGLTPSFLDHIAINCFAPLLYAYGQHQGDENLQERALDWLHQIPAERNTITAHFGQFGLLAQHAGDSQAQLQLHREYCEPKQCLSCAIGVHLIRRP